MATQNRTDNKMYETTVVLRNSKGHEEMMKNVATSFQGVTDNLFTLYAEMEMNEEWRDYRVENVFTTRTYVPVLVVGRRGRV